jgi:parvulin-like peptidyl-prolyl isomerase
MRTETWGIVITLLILYIFSISPAAAVVDRIVAVVNNDIITLSELNRTIEPFIKNMGKTQNIQGNEELVNRARKIVLGSMINNMLINQEASKLGIVVDEKDVDQALTNMLKEKKISMDRFREILSERGVTMDDYKKEMRTQIVRMRVVGKEIRSKIGVSNEEIGEYYAKHRGEYEGKESVRILQILIIVPEDTVDEKRDILRKNAEGILERLKQGESFAELAMKYSQGPAAQAGGDLGFIEKGVMFPTVDKAAFQLKVNEISDVIASPVGFHIIKIADKRGAGVKPLEDVRDEIKESITNEKAQKKFEEWIEERRKKSLIEVRLD